MDPELKRLLEENHALAKDNHRLLRAVRRHQLIETFGKYIFWIIVIGSSVYYYQVYLKPIAAKFQASGTPTPASSFFSSTSAEIQKLLNSGKTGQ